MFESKTSPAPEVAGPENAGPYRQDNTLDLSAFDNPSMDNASLNNATTRNGTSRKSTAWRLSLGGAVLMAGICCAGFGLGMGNSDESEHPNWQHVAAATDASQEGMNQFVRATAAGTTETLPAIELTSADANRMATWRVRAALMRNDLAAATAALQAAQVIPVSPGTDVQPPNLNTSPELVAALQDGRTELFQMELFDCCQEDGDVVEVGVNGNHFATVPIMNAGTLLSMPLSSGDNTVTVRGVRDGRGGVTLSVRTSRGDFFARKLRVGEECQLGVTVR